MHEQMDRELKSIQGFTAPPMNNLYKKKLHFALDSLKLKPGPKKSFRDLSLFMARTHKDLFTIPFILDNLEQKKFLQKYLLFINIIQQKV